MGRILGDIKTASPLSRQINLAVVIGLVIDLAVHASGELLLRGALLGKILSGNGTVGNYRAYFEGTVKSGNAFGTSAATFGVDLPNSPLAKNLRVGDVLESTAGVALGTVLTWDPVAGTGTLAANSAAVLAAGNTFRVTEASLSIASKNGKILSDEVLMDANNAPASGWVEGYFIQARTTVTAAALTKMGGANPSTGEMRI